jgi:hypothetical protein
MCAMVKDKSFQDIETCDNMINEEVGCNWCGVIYHQHGFN